MLIVVAHVEYNGVQRPIIRVGFIAFPEHVMFGNEVASHRMKSHGQEGAYDKVGQRAVAAHVQQYDVEGKLNGEVQHLQHGQRFGSQEQRAKRVEEGLQQYPQELGEGVVEKSAFKVRGNVHIHFIIPLVLVMLDVILLKDDRVWHANDEVTEDSQQPVSPRILVAKSKIVGDLVNGQSHGVVDDPTEAVGYNHDHSPRSIAH